MKYDSNLYSILANTREVRERISSSDAREEFVDYFAKNLAHNAKVLFKHYNSFKKRETLNALLRNDDMVQDQYGGIQNDISNLADNFGNLLIATYASDDLIEGIAAKREKTGENPGSLFWKLHPSKVLDHTQLPEINGTPLLEYFGEVHKYKAEESPMKQRRHIEDHEGSRALIERRGLEYITTEIDAEPGKLATEVLGKDLDSYLGFVSSALNSVVKQRENYSLTDRTSTDKKRNTRHYWRHVVGQMAKDTGKTLGLATAMCTVAGLGIFGWGSFETLKQTEEKLEDQKISHELTELGLEALAFDHFVKDYEGLWGPDWSPVVDQARVKVAKSIQESLKYGTSTTNNFKMDLVNIYSEMNL